MFTANKNALFLNFAQEIMRLLIVFKLLNFRPKVKMMLYISECKRVYDRPTRLSRISGSGKTCSLF